MWLIVAMTVLGAIIDGIGLLGIIFVLGYIARIDAKLEASGDRTRKRS